MTNTPKDLSEFLANEQFVNWVLHPDQANNGYWTTWMMENPHRQEDVEAARQLILLMDIKPIHVSEQHIQQIKAGYKRTIAEEKRSNGRVFRFLKLAAVVALVLSGVFWVFLLTDYEIKHLENLSTINGEKSRITLSDGSEVWLNGGSRLVYDRNFTDKSERVVFLEGEAFFDVTHDASRPFIVKTGPLEVVVKGTSFNISAYPEDLAVETVLVEGAVEIRTGGDPVGESVGNMPLSPVILQPDQQAVYQKLTRQISLREVDAERLSSWKKGMLIFDNTKLSDVVRKLERWYGVPIEIESGGDCKVSAKFENESLKEVLELFHLTSRISYRRSGGKVLLTIECQN